MQICVTFSISRRNISHFLFFNEFSRLSRFITTGIWIISMYFKQHWFLLNCSNLFFSYKDQKNYTVSTHSTNIFLSFLKNSTNTYTRKKGRHIVDKNTFLTTVIIVCFSFFTQVHHKIQISQALFFLKTTPNNAFL